MVPRRQEGQHAGAAACQDANRHADAQHQPWNQLAHEAAHEHALAVARQLGAAACGNPSASDTGTQNMHTHYKLRGIRLRQHLMLLSLAWQVIRS
jgi:hypothetical protein